MIRNFIYLDSDKFRSISSQLFEGLIEQIISTKSDVKTNSEDQKGPVGSGQVLGNIFSQEGSSSELRFMEDYAYTLFEERLESDDLVDIVDIGTDTQVNKSFVKITCKLRLNDLSATANTLTNFNELGEAFWRVGNESMVWTSNGPKIASEGEAKKKVGEGGLQMNKKVTDAAVKIIDYGFEGVLESNMLVKDRLFSAPLKRQSLREDERMILHKYSRFSATEFTMLGIVTQVGGKDDHVETLADVSEADGIKEAMRSVSLHMRTLERLFLQPSPNETIIDPIAIYSVL